MSFTAITTAQVDTGEPVSTTLGNLIRTNSDDHETRIVSLEGGASVTYVPFYFFVDGLLNNNGIEDEIVGFLRIPFNLTVVGARIVQGTAGSGGSTTCDFERRRSGSWDSVLTALPSVASGAGNYGLASGTLDATKTALVSGDLLRMNLDAIQTGNPESILGIIEFTKG